MGAYKTPPPHTHTHTATGSQGHSRAAAEGAGSSDKAQFVWGGERRALTAELRIERPTKRYDVGAGLRLSTLATGGAQDTAGTHSAPL
eukprot:gene6676-biopygen8471